MHWYVAHTKPRQEQRALTVVQEPLCLFQFYFEGETRRRRANDEDSTFSTARSERGSQRSVTDEMELE